MLKGLCVLCSCFTRPCLSALLVTGLRTETCDCNIRHGGQEYDGSALRNVLEEMTPGNARVVWMSKDFQASPMQLLPVGWMPQAQCLCRPAKRCMTA